MTQAPDTALLNGDITGRIQARRNRYGGSDPTHPSFLRPQYVKYNAISKSQDFGLIDNLVAGISGTIGGNTGAQTLFFQVRLKGPADLRIASLGGNPREQQYISLGILGPDRKPLNLSPSGFAQLSDIHGTENDESTQPLPAGTYTFTVSSSQWQSLPYAVLLQVLRYRELIGTSVLEMNPVARLSQARLVGTALQQGVLVGLLSAIADVDALEGTAGGGDATSATLTIPRGEIVGRLILDGRLRVNWRLSGTAGGQLEASGTLSVGGSGGYG